MFTPKAIIVNTHTHTHTQTGLLNNSQREAISIQYEILN
jgi:hypothetical protein